MRRVLVLPFAIAFALLISAKAASPPQPAAGVSYVLPQSDQQRDRDESLRVSPPTQIRVDSPSPMASPAQLETRGDELRGAKLFLDAMDYYHAALAKAPTAELYTKLGITGILMSRLDDARKDFERAIKLDKRYPEAYNNLGVVNYLRKNYGRAERYYRKALALREDSASFHNNLGQAYFSDKRFGEAAMEFRRALELDPDVFERASRTGVAAQISSPLDRAHFSYVLAQIYARGGEVEKSLMYLRRAIEEGYSNFKEATRDEAFKSVREDPRFAELMSARLTVIPRNEEPHP